MTTPTIDWSNIALPLTRLTRYSLKDPALTFHDGWFHLVASIFNSDNHSELGAWRSRDLATWEGPIWRLGAGADGWCSPDIIQHNDQFIMTFQSWDAIPPRQSKNQLFYATSQDAATWSGPKPLAADITQGVRAIDAALAQHDGTWYLLYKEAQQPRLATAPSIDGPWQLLPEPFPCWAENGQFVNVDGTWHLIATLLHHEQGFATITGDPNTVASWTSWSDFTTMPTPVRPGFNDSSPANASSLWDGRAVDGHWYRVYCSAQQPTDSNWGYELGIARSKDLRAWELPPRDQ